MSEKFLFIDFRNFSKRIIEHSPKLYFFNIVFFLNPFRVQVIELTDTPDFIRGHYYYIPEGYVLVRNERSDLRGI